MSNMKLQTILEAFNAPLTEEQAWALCYQCSTKIQNDQADEFFKISSHTSAINHLDEKISHEVLVARSVIIASDGDILTLGEHHDSG